MYVERTFKFKTMDDWITGETACWYEYPFSLMLPLGGSCKFITDKLDCPLRIFMNDIDKEKQCISLKDKRPELTLEQWKDRIILISEPVKVKRSNGKIYTAKYVFLINSSKEPFLRLHWQNIEDGNNTGIQVDMNVNDCWMELPDKYEGE